MTAIASSTPLLLRCPEADRPVTEPLLPRVAAGDATATRECIDRYARLVWALARRFGFDGAEAEDAVQDVFVDLWQSAARFDRSRGSETTFVATLTRRRLIDRVRRSERRPLEVSLPDDADVAVVESDDLELDGEVRAALGVIDELSPDRRRVLLMSLWNGRTHAEIADETGLPLGTVKSHIRLGLNEVRERLADRSAR